MEGMKILWVSLCGSILDSDCQRVHWPTLVTFFLSFSAWKISGTGCYDQGRAAGRARPMTTGSPKEGSFADTPGHVTCKVIRDLVCSVLQITDHYRALTAIQHYIEGRTVPTLDRTLVVNFVTYMTLSCT